MTAIKFSQLRLTTTVTGEMVFPAVQNGGNVKVTLDQIKNYTVPSWQQITNKPSFAEIAFSGDYAVLVNKPIIPSDNTQLTNGRGFITTASLTWNNITGKPIFFSGNYNDLTNKPDLTAYVTSTALTNTLSSYATESFVTSQNYLTTSSLTWNNIFDKPIFATVATSGRYTDLSDKPLNLSDFNNDIGAGTITVIAPDDTEISGISTLAFTGTGVTVTSAGNAVTLDISGGAGTANTGDFTFVATDMSVPVGQPMTLSTYQSGGNKESKLTLSTGGLSSLDVGNNLRIRIANGTGFEYDWQFLSDGSIQFPDQTKQYTAFTSTVDLSAVNQSIIPSQDKQYDLGSIDKQWRSLYVSTGTIFIGGVPLTVNTSSNTLVIGTSTNTTATQSVNLATEIYVDEAVANSQRLEIDGGFASTDYTAELIIDGGGA